MKTLSDKRYKSYEPDFHYKEGDESLKEAVRRLKRNIDALRVETEMKTKEIIKEIDKIFGDKLVEKEE